MRSSHWLRAHGPRLIFLTAIVGTLALLAARLDLRPDLAHVRVRLLSGAPEGNYHALAGSIAAAAMKRGGRIENVP
jgi:hypothetical protein